MRIRLAVDIGNTRIKIGLFDNDKFLILNKHLISELKKEKIIDTPLKFKEWLFSQSDWEIEEIAFSISGRIDHNLNTIIKSDVLGNPFAKCNFKSLFFPIPVRIYNDGIASSLAFKYITTYDSYPFPCLCISLGTGVAISVIDLACENNYEIFDCSNWVNSSIGSSEGIIPLHKAIKSKEKSKINNVQRYTNRVIRSIDQIIKTKYFKRFKYKPLTIFLNGGQITDLNLEKIETDLKIKLCASVNDDKQIIENMFGILNATKDNSTIKLYAV